MHTYDRQNTAIPHRCAPHSQSFEPQHSVHHPAATTHDPPTQLSEALVQLTATVSSISPIITQQERFNQLCTHFNQTTAAVHEFSVAYHFSQHAASAEAYTYQLRVLMKEYGWLKEQIRMLGDEFRAYSRYMLDPLHELSRGAEFGTKRSRYKLLGSPLRGTRSTVWRVEHVSGRPLAAKFYSRKADFERERDMLKRLPKTGVPHYVRLFAVIEAVPGTTGCCDVLIVDYCEITLKDYCESMHSTMPLASTRHIVSGILQGLEACHAAGIVHCNLKPENIMLHKPDDADARWVLAGFDCARLMHESVSMNTVKYTAPEVARAYVQGVPVAATPAMDMWGMGHILHLLLSSRPFWPSTTMQRGMLTRLASGTFTVSIDGLPHNEAATVRELLTAHPRDRLQLAQLKANLLSRMWKAVDHVHQT